MKSRTINVALLTAVVMSGDESLLPNTRFALLSWKHPRYSTSPSPPPELVGESGIVWPEACLANVAAAATAATNCRQSRHHVFR